MDKRTPNQMLGQARIIEPPNWNIVVYQTRATLPGACKVEGCPGGCNHGDLIDATRIPGLVLYQWCTHDNVGKMDPAFPAMQELVRQVRAKIALEAQKRAGVDNGHRPEK